MEIAMKRVAYGFALLLLCSGVAAAQSQTSSPGVSSGQPAGGTTPDTDSTPPNVADHPGANGSSAGAGDVPSAALPGVTVTKRNKACAKNDPSCYEQVSAEIWRKYPEQIATMCKNERIRRMRLGFQETELGLDGSQVNRLTPQTEALCDYGPAHGLAAK
jgi:hypothetical protein